MEGDYVTYFNRVRLVAGLLAMIALLAEVAAAAAVTAEAAKAAAAVLATIRELAVAFGLTLPALSPAP